MDRESHRQDEIRLIYYMNGEPRIEPAAEIVEAVADVKEVDPVSLPPLFERIDPDALNRLLSAETAGEIHLAFRYCGVDVRVHRVESPHRVPDDAFARSADR
ncbi:HalOD1 output domain-containing protein [Natrialbaceae archaeon GCM10025810]